MPLDQATLEAFNFSLQSAPEPDYKVADDPLAAFQFSLNSPPDWTRANTVHEAGLLDEISPEGQQAMARGVAQGAMSGDGPIARNAMATLGDVGLSLGSMGARISHATGLDEITRQITGAKGTGKSDADYLNHINEEMRRIASEGDKENKVVSPLLARTGRSVIASLIPAIASGGTGPAIAYGALNVGNQSLTEGQDAGLTGLPLAGYAAGQGAIEAGTELAFAKIPGLGSVAKRLGMPAVAPRGSVQQSLRTILGEAAQEALTEAGQAGLRRTIDPRALDNLGQQMFEAALGGAAGGAAVEGFHAPANIEHSLQRGQRLKELRGVRADQQTANVFNDAAWGTQDVAKSTVDQLLAAGKTPQQIRELATSPTSKAFEESGLGSRKERTMPTADARRAFGENATKYLESLNVPEAEAQADQGNAAANPAGQQPADAGEIKYTGEVAPAGQPVEPPVPAGHVRLYHGGGADIEKGGRRWLTQYRDYAEGYANKSGGEVSYVDVPEGHPELEKSFDDTDTGGTKSPYINFEASPELTKGLRPLRTPLAPRTGQQYQKDVAGSPPAEEIPAESPIGRTRKWKDIVDYQAKKWDMQPKEYEQFAEQVWGEQGQYISEVDAARKHAAKALGLNARDINRLENSGKDVGSIKGLDVVAAEVANNYPTLGWQHLVEESSSQLEEKLWNLLKAGKQKAPGKFSPAFHGKVDDFLGNLEASVSFNPAEFEKVRAEEDTDERKARRDYAWGFFGGGSTRARNPTIPGPVKAPDVEVERQLDAAYGVPKQTILGRIAGAAKAIYHSGRSQFHVPTDTKHATMNEMFRLLKQQPATAQDEANRNIAAITGPLSEPHLQLFTRKVITDNLLASVDRGEPLRFGFKDRAEVAAYKAQLDALAARSPEVQESIKRRGVVVKGLYDRLRSLDLLPEMTPDQVENYYHQQVLTYQQLPGHSRNPQLKKRGFQRGRTKGVDEFEEDLNYNTSYLEAEYEWMRDAYTQAAKEQWLRDLAKRFDVLPKIKADAKTNGTDWHDDLRKSDTHKLWQAAPGNTFYAAVSIPERVVADVLANIVPTVDVSKDQLREVLAMGGPQRQLALPNELAEQLDSMKDATRSGDRFTEGAATLNRELVKAWKVWTLFQPLRALAYNLRNMTGDIDPVIGGAAFSLRYAKKSLSDMVAYHGIIRQQELNLSPEMKAARDLGVIDSTLTASDIPDVKDLEIFRRFVTSKSGVVDIAARYFAKMKKYSAFRESLARYAAFLGFRDALNAGTLAHYGGAKKATVDALVKEMGVDVAAAHLSRNLLGDYGDITVMGNFLRQNVFPFYSWQEVNFKRYPMMAVNAAAYGGRKVRNRGAAAALSAGALGMIAMPYLLMQLWNRLRYPDEEDELSDAERASPHIIWGRNSDGSIRILRNTGAMGDFLENFGVETAVARLDELQAGQMTPQEVAVEMGKGIVGKQINSIRPDIKGTGEAIAGQSLYPDPFNPRTMDRSKIVASNLGLRDAQAEIVGRLTQSGERARPHFVERTIGVTDPKQEAFFQIVELRDRFLGKLDEKGQFKANPHFRNMQQAAQADDQQAFNEAKAAYLKDGGTYEKLADRLKNLGPLAHLSAENKAKFINTYLTPDQKKKLLMAQDYGENMRVKMWTMLRDEPNSGAKVP